MTKFGWILSLSVFSVILLVFVGIFLTRENVAPPEEVEKEEVAVPEDLSMLSIYTNGEYGFSFMYPKAAVLSDAYTQATTTKNKSNITTNEITIASLTLGESSVSITQNSTVKEKTSCLKANPSEKMLADTVVGSTTWKTFSFDQLGTENEQRVTSYRAILPDGCFIIKQRQPIQQLQENLPLNIVISSFTFAN